ncbi:MAG TPA: hypothetical protein VFK50_08815 [Sphingomicrobium sp.]|nr:hypothetical protein [Sphingomicrobium sp.]
MATTEERVIAATWRFMEGRGGWDGSIEPDDAVCQDLMIFGIDVDDFVWELEEEFGPVVWTIPWGDYTDQTNSYRGCRACVVAPFMIPKLLIEKVIFGDQMPSRPHPKDFPHRLTIKEIAQAIEAGGW